MEWFQFITLIATMIGGVFAFYKMTQEKISKMEEFHRQDIKKHDEELKGMRQETREEFSRVHEEFSKVHSLWANLLEKIGTLEKQILEIKLDQSRKI